MTGTLHGIGVGPGDPELITLKAARLLASLPVIAWPAPLEGESLARRIAAAHIPAGREEIAIRLPFAPDRSALPAYDAGAAAIATWLDQDRDVGLLCEGDPMLYGSFIHILERLRGRFPIEIVPGISAPFACAARAGRPLASGNEALAILPATRPESEIEQVLATADSAAVLKPGRHLGKVARVAAQLGWLESGLHIERAGQADERILPLTEAAASGADAYFATILLRRPAR